MRLRFVLLFKLDNNILLSGIFVMGLCSSKRIDIENDYDLDNRICYKPNYRILYEIKIIDNRMSLIKHYVIYG
jgi:hypothetical protein